MTSPIRSLRTALVLLVVVLAAAVPTAHASTFAPQNATEAVMQAQGYVEATAEANAIIAQVTAAGLPHVSFRTMAVFQTNLADLAARFGLPALALYFVGRSQAFSAVADLVGEPIPTFS